MKLVFDRADSPDLFYRCGFHSDARCLYAEDENKRVLWVPGFEYLRAQKEVNSIEIRQLASLKETLSELQGPFEVGSLFPYSLAQHLQGDVEVVQELFAERKIKSAEEQAAIQDAQRVAAQAIGRIIQEIESGTLENGVLVKEGAPVTSERLKALARGLLIEQGYDCPELIIASGEQTAQPHNRGSGPIVQGPVIIDIFPQSTDTLFHGDMTRAVIVGEHERAQRLLEAVRHAHRVCVEECVPGVRVCDLFALCIQRLEEAGFSTTDEEGMIHSLGHGIGLAVHEHPSLSPKSEAVLEEGMVVSIEPGLYYDVGVRWEDLVIVGEGVIDTQPGHS